MPADVRALALRQDPDRRQWVIAWGLTVALHALVVILVQSGRHWTATPRPAPQPEPLHLTFVGAPPAAKIEPRSPSTFTELPSNRADLAPKHADFLSNVTSRARDNVPGGNQALPRMNGDIDAPSVAMQPGKVAPAPTNTPTPQDAQQPTAAEQKLASDAAGSARVVPSRPMVLRDPGPSNPPAMPGSSDIHQGEMDNPNGNAELTGETSLSTTAWEYAPWMQRFGRRLMANWIAPAAYYMGILREGGWTTVEMEIARSGQVLRMDILEQQGHPSLTTAAVGALHTISPMEALPADFPDKTLILRVRLIYPKIRH